MSIFRTTHALLCAAIAIAAAGAAVVVQILWRPMDVLTNIPLHVLKRLGLFPLADGRGGIRSYGWGNVPEPPYWFHVCIQRLKHYSWELAVLAIAIAVYTVLLSYFKRRLPPADGVTRCGRCGYDLHGLTELRCPECGAAVGMVESLSLSVRLQQVARTVARFGCCALVFLALNRIAGHVDEWLWPWRPPGFAVYRVNWQYLSAAWYPQNWSTVAELSAFTNAALVLSLVVAIALYHRMVFRTVWRPGPTRCGGCGIVLNNLVEPRCTSCGRAF